MHKEGHFLRFIAFLTKKSSCLSIKSFCTCSVQSSDTNSKLSDAVVELHFSALFRLAVIRAANEAREAKRLAEQQAVEGEVRKYSEGQEYCDFLRSITKTSPYNRFDARLALVQRTLCWRRHRVYTRGVTIKSLVS